jgi:hypothetical protein
MSETFLATEDIRTSCEEIYNQGQNLLRMTQKRKNKALKEVDKNGFISKIDLLIGSLQTIKSKVNGVAMTLEEEGGGTEVVAQGEFDLKSLEALYEASKRVANDARTRLLSKIPEQLVILKDEYDRLCATVEKMKADIQLIQNLLDSVHFHDPGEDEDDDDMTYADDSDVQTSEDEKCYFYSKHPKVNKTVETASPASQEPQTHFVGGAVGGVGGGFGEGVGGGVGGRLDKRESLRKREGNVVYSGDSYKKRQDGNKGGRPKTAMEIAVERCNRGRAVREKHSSRAPSEIFDEVLGVY